MSTFSRVIGSVTLDQSATAGFFRSVTWREYINDTDNPSDGISFVKTKSGVIVEFSEAYHRNIGRFVLGDLRAAQFLGNVSGCVTVLCDDGGLSKEVAVFEGRSCLVGSASCYDKPVNMQTARRFKVSNLEASFVYPDGVVTDLFLVGDTGSEGCPCGN